MHRTWRKESGRSAICGLQHLITTVNWSVSISRDLVLFGYVTLSHCPPESKFLLLLQIVPLNFLSRVLQLFAHLEAIFVPWYSFDQQVKFVYDQEPLSFNLTPIHFNNAAKWNQSSHWSFDHCLNSCEAMQCILGKSEWREEHWERSVVKFKDSYKISVYLLSCTRPNVELET